MANVTYYVVLPFVRNQEGELCPDEPIECPSSGAAITRARQVASTKAGAIAFFRSGDPNVGDFADAVILERFGETPANLETA